MTAQLIALGIFIAVFAIAAVRNVNIGIVMFPAFAAGLLLAWSLRPPATAGEAPVRAPA